METDAARGLVAFFRDWLFPVIAFAGAMCILWQACQ